MLGNWDARAQEEGMNGAGAVRRVVDIQGVNANQSGAGITQELGNVAGEKGMAGEVGRGGPMAIPAGTDQNRLALEILTMEEININGPLLHHGGVYQQSGKIRQPF